MPIVPAKQLVIDAFKDIKKYQEGGKLPIVTPYSHMNEISWGGLINGWVVTVCGLSECGKSYMLQKIEEAFLDVTLNPNASKHILLRNNWETQVIMLVMRRLKSNLDVQSFREILYKKPTPEMLRIYKDVQKEMIDGRIFYSQENTGTQQWIDETSNFCEKHSDADTILISIDHAGLNEDGVKILMNAILTLKRKYLNVIFFLLCQFNREIYKRIENPLVQAPQESDLFESSRIMQDSDLVVVVHNPYRKFRITDYMNVRTNDPLLEHLKKWMLKPNANRSPLRAENMLYYHYLKFRHSDDITKEKRIFAEELGQAVVTDSKVEASPTNLF